MSGQLASALQSRVAIEQAKAVLADRLRVNHDEAFRLMRNHARLQRRKLSDVASEVIEGSSVIGSGARPEHR
ncbi:ANTAR domain-containing protein [Streptomyces sp. NPDC047197]|uniref:ANTAR domain-containing protein n=1 Tax=Streptomyces sp. NPDC047197 TaxID=3155477 RepID=UPI0033FA34C0